MKYDTIQELRAFDNDVFEAVQEFLDNRDGYQEDVVLSVNPKTHEICIDSPSNCNGLDQYSITTLIRKADDGTDEPDCDATNELASKYFFVR